ncbi:MAG: sugar ABC transporter permease [Clostridia bacterium]|nr:sugar ABC transporter permease [Clostridia bacterium]
MVLVAFTNYDHAHQPPGKLFTWVGGENFTALLAGKQQPVSFTITSHTEEITTLTITARNGDVLAVGTHDHAAAQAAADLTRGGEADFTLEEQADGWRVEVRSPQGQAGFAAVSLNTVHTPSYAATFRQVLAWTLIWAVFATFLNYFLGVLAAMLINRRGVRLKKLWRTLLVTTIAVPQFVSLLYVSKLFAADGLVNGLLMSWGWIDKPLPFWTDPTWARVMVILINVWVGVPYVMLIATGILMNIPADLYEAARIDGANAFQTYTRITMPYMLFITGPYLLTSFTGNINNFNVIFLLSQGRPLSLDMAGNAGSTDLLITWLYKMTVTDSNYKLAAVIGVAVFVVCALVNLAVYNLIPSVRREEEFQP